MSTRVEHEPPDRREAANAPDDGMRLPDFRPRRLARGGTGRQGRMPVPDRAGSGDGRGPWQYARNVSAAGQRPSGQETRLERRDHRMASRQLLWELTTLKRLAACGRFPLGTEVVTKLAETQVAHYAGLETCGSIWACPVCSAKIRNRRSEEISEGCQRWMDGGNSIVMLTLTARHHSGLRLDGLFDAISAGWRHLLQGRRWQTAKKRLGIVGQIRAIEVTHGGNGWHPHIHVLLVIQEQVDPVALVEVVAGLRARWADWLVSRGFDRPSERHGVHFDIAHSGKEAGAYVAKAQDVYGKERSVGNELTRLDLKRGRDGNRTPFQLLTEALETGDFDDITLWWEYETTTKGRQAITWSAHLRKLLLPEEEQKTDEEVAAEEVGGRDIAVFVMAAWKRVTAIPGLPAAILSAAEAGGIEAGFEAIAELIKPFGIAPKRPEVIIENARGNEL